MKLKFEKPAGKGIRLRIAGGGKRAYYYVTAVEVGDHQWGDGRVVRHPKARHLNSVLAAIVKRAEGAVVALAAEGRPEPADIRDALKKPVRSVGDTVADYIRSEAPYRDVAPETIKKSYVLANLLDAWDAQPALADLDRVRLKALERYLLGRPSLRGGTLSAATVRNYLNTLKPYVREAYAQRIIPADPFVSYRMPRGLSSPYDFLTADELEAWAAVDVAGADRECRDAFVFAVASGLRVKDLRALTAAAFEIDRESVRMVVIPEKTARKGTVVALPLDDLFGGVGARMARERAGGHPGGPLFRLPDVRSTYAILDRVAKRAGIAKHVTWHVARHTCATQLLNAGMSLSAVARVLGHRSVSTTERYARMLEATVGAEARRVFGR